MRPHFNPQTQSQFSYVNVCEIRFVLTCLSLCSGRLLHHSLHCFDSVTLNSEIMPIHIDFIIYEMFLLMHDWTNHVIWLNMPLLKLGNVRVLFPNFQNCTLCKKHLKGNKHSSLQLAWIYALIFLLGQNWYLFLRAHSVNKSSQTVCFLEQKMSADKHPSIFWRPLFTSIYE